MRIILFLLFFPLGLLAQVINEYVVYHSSSCTGNRYNLQFIEFKGDANTSYSHLSLLQLRGASSAGVIHASFSVGTTDQDGIWWTGFQNNGLTDQSSTFLLVSDFAGTVGSDLDTNDDGVFDVTPWSAVLDSVAVELSGGVFYTAVVLRPNFDPSSFSPQGASRIPDGLDTDQISDWRRNDYSGEGFPYDCGFLDSYEAINTPGSPNRISYAEYPAPFLSEVALTFSFGESNEYLEIIGQPELSLSPFYLLILEGDAGENPGVVDFLHPLGTTDFRGLYHTGYLVDQLENGSQTIFIVSQPTCTIGQDLDTNDDGVLDATPWAEESDGLSLLQSEGDVGYATQTLEAMGQRISGASRFPQFEPPSGTPRWIANNGEGAGLNNTVVTLDPNTAANTPGELNRINREEYYLQVNKENSAALRASLHDLIDDHVKHGYTSDNRDVWDIMNAADEDPTDPSKIIAIYKNESYTKIPGGTGVYNREHTWPKSYGFGGDDEPCKVPYTDCHHLMASNAVYNSSRNNLFFDDCTGNCTSDPALFNAANGAGGTPEDVNLRDGDSYQVWPHRRGDIARAMFYMDVRYEGGNHGFTGCDEPDLVLTDNASLIQVTDQSPAYMGLLTTLLAWHEQDPVDDDERLRNETVYLYQGNRNPFVDHPEYIDCLYNDQCEGGIVLPSCFFARLLLWRSQGAPFCSNSDFSSVQGLVELINGTCECP